MCMQSPTGEHSSLSKDKDINGIKQWLLANTNRKLAPNPKKLNNWCNVETPELNTNGLYTSNATATLKKPNLGQQGWKKVNFFANPLDRDKNWLRLKSKMVQALQTRRIWAEELFSKIRKQSLLSFSFRLPAHVFSSIPREYPALHSHTNDPGVLIQVSLQPSVFLAHSSTSEKQRRG